MFNWILSGSRIPRRTKLAPKNIARYPKSLGSNLRADQHSPERQKESRRSDGVALLVDASLERQAIVLFDSVVVQLGCHERAEGSRHNFA